MASLNKSKIYDETNWNNFLGCLNLKEPLWGPIYANEAPLGTV
jgi:hypothetical protein